jgi:hypothetical protein
MTQPGTSVSPSNSPRATRPLHRSAILVLAAIMMVLVGVTTGYEASTGALPSSDSSPADSAGPGYATNAGYVTNVSTISRAGKSPRFTSLPSRSVLILPSLWELC